MDGQRDSIDRLMKFAVDHGLQEKDLGHVSSELAFLMERVDPNGRMEVYLEAADAVFGIAQIVAKMNLVSTLMGFLLSRGLLDDALVYAGASSDSIVQKG